MSNGYWVRRAGVYMGKDCDFGQIVTLELPSPKAEQLTRLGYLVATDIKRGKDRILCGVCGVEFLSEADRDAHGRRRHSNRFGGDNPLLEDEHEEREEAAMAQRAPLYLENTIAARQ